MGEKSYKTYKLVTDKNGKRFFIDKDTGKPLHKAKQGFDITSLLDRARKLISDAKDAAELVRADVESIRRRDPAAKSNIEVLALYSGMHAVLAYRVAHKLYVTNHFLSARAISQLARWITGIEIHPGATIGKYFFMDHGTGIVVGETSIIGEHVKIYQGVTIGALSTKGGHSLFGKRRHPTIEDNVTIYSGASILGGETTIGAGSIIGSNVFITSPIAPNTRISNKTQEYSIKRRGEKVTIESEDTEKDINWIPDSAPDFSI